MDMLIDILSMRREHNSDGEMNFIGKYLTPLQCQLKFDDEGNVLAYVFDNSKGKSTVMWSCHIDTMHRNNTKEPERLTQEVWVDDQGIAFVSDKEDCLGADDGAGIWLMLEMIKADVAGTYVFHRGEEKGCWGSSRMALHHKEWLANFTHAIAFDRRGNHSVITHQTGARACSDALGTKLCQLLGMEHELDPTGVYTDTAEYMEIIPECVNISSGYQSEHSSKEILDTTYLLTLRDAMCAVDWLNVELPVDRDPAVYEGRYNGYSGYGGWGSSWRDYGSSLTELDPKELPTAEEIQYASPAEIERWVRKASTDNVAWLIEDLAAEIAQLKYQLEDAQFLLDDNDDDSDMHLKVGL